MHPTCETGCWYKRQTEQTGAYHLTIGKMGAKNKTKKKYQSLKNPQGHFRGLRNKTNTYQSKAPKQEHEGKLQRCECWKG